MSDFPSLTDPIVSRHSLVLGFAYSLTPEGLPGAYNEQIAKQIKAVILSAVGQEKEDRPWIGMQWEIFDAIESEWDKENIKLLKIVPLSHVGGPPLFSADDISDPMAIISQLKMWYEDLLKQGSRQYLTKPSTQAGRKLADKVARLIERVGYQTDESSNATIFDAAMFDAVKLAQYFNWILLNDMGFHKSFYDDNNQPILELHDLYRTNVGSVGVENRRLPNIDKDLLRFQKVRVNRLIIEAIFPDDRILKRGEYLSTRGVLDQVTRVLEREGGREIKYAFVYGHPAHSPRCRRQVIESGWMAGWNLEPEKVCDVNNTDPREQEKWQGEKRWDAKTAQIWCRSEQNWNDYERMGKARLD